MLDGKKRVLSFDLIVESSMASKISNLLSEKIGSSFSAFFSSTAFFLGLPSSLC